MLFVILTALSLVLIWFIGKALKRNLLPEMILGLIIGFSWELTTAPLWNYNISNLTLFYIEGQEISLDVILLWGSTLGALSLIIEFMQKMLFKKSNKLTFLLSGIISFIVVGWAIEFLGTTYGFWTYSWDFNLHILGVPVIVLYGWAFASVLYMSTIKIYANEIRKLLGFR
ncbi:MAG TPA: hypothetical protein VJJ76_00145 [archaeon]|nr:hypothetical protein [archaeon]